MQRQVQGTGRTVPPAPAQEPQQQHEVPSSPASRLLRLQRLKESRSGGTGAGGAGSGAAVRPEGVGEGSGPGHLASESSELIGLLQHAELQHDPRDTAGPFDHTHVHAQQGGCGG